jgi:hypothetical protein
MTDFNNPDTRITGYKVLATDWNILANNFKFFDETRYLELDIAESHPPLSDVTAAPIELVESSGAAPNPAWYQALFDASTVEARQWSKPIPPEYKDSPAIEFLGYMGTATSGTVVVSAYISSSGAGSNGTSITFDAANAATITVPGTAGICFAGTISMTNNDSMAAKDHAIFMLARSGTATADTAGGDLKIKSVAFRYGI